MEPFILSIDAGTTGITVLILDKQASICKKYYKEFTQYYPQSGWVEHDGEEIWSVTLMLLQSAFHDFSPNNLQQLELLINVRPPWFGTEKPENPFIMLLCGNAVAHRKSAVNLNKLVMRTLLVKKLAWSWIAIFPEQK